MNKNILVVDDEPSMLKLLQIILSKKYKVTLKNNGYEAMIWLLEGNYPDLIILDRQIPYLNAVEFVKSIKISGMLSAIPLVVLTEVSDADNHDPDLIRHVNLIINKPFNPLKLQNEISNLLAN
ncbi:response regulator [Haoranjiania flava]|uniref:Response regulator n=1 Tax=Haoranjiania flava TaxID=1856322 RepID=A0AAE3IL23_9BACT|nr:response regulator [Haoranjiania flava]MCU7694192.1 response regulator [Haoranjiania flava]